MDWLGKGAAERLSLGCQRALTEHKGQEADACARAMSSGATRACRTGWQATARFRTIPGASPPTFPRTSHLRLRTGLSRTTCRAPASCQPEARASGAGGADVANGDSALGQRQQSGTHEGPKEGQAARQAARLPLACNSREGRVGGRAEGGQ